MVLSKEEVLTKALAEPMAENRGLRNINNLIRLQEDSLGKVPTDYMVGLYNGLELARATIEGNEPKFKDTVGTKIVLTGRTAQGNVTNGVRNGGK